MQFWWAHCVHLVVGQIAGYCLTAAPAVFLSGVPAYAPCLFGLAVIGTVWKRQEMEWRNSTARADGEHPLRRVDTPGIDLAYHIGGLLLGGLLGALTWGV